ncbi:MAG: hypothetical protein NWE92_02690 [Candidatus Bathyarchaeota archaeon]|nr:hypothetical protein [Candidatus Bathyarchaeota archaeon]
MLTQKHKTIYIILTAALIICLLILLYPQPIQPSQTNTIHGDNVGICVHDLPYMQATQVKDSGAGWIRIDASNNPQLNNFSISVQNAKAQNLQVLVILDSWMFDQSTVFTLQEWQSNVTYYVSQHADYVDAWEIFNEPSSWKYPLLGLNLSNQQSQENLTKIADFYYQMAQTAAPIIRQYDPTAKILLLGGCHLYTDTDPQISLDEAFAEKVVSKGIEHYGDGISLHAYPWGKSDTVLLQQKYDEALVYYRELFGDSMEVWVTETGKPLEEADEAGQATYMADVIEYFYGRVDKVFWYLLQDYPDDRRAFGLIGGDGVARPAYGELQKILGK